MGAPPKRTLDVYGIVDSVRSLCEETKGLRKAIESRRGLMADAVPYVRRLLNAAFAACEGTDEEVARMRVMIATLEEALDESQKLE